MNKHWLTAAERAEAWERVRTAQRIQENQVYEAHKAAKQAALTARVLRSHRGTLHLAHPTGARRTLCNQPIAMGRSSNVADHLGWAVADERWERAGEKRCKSCVAAS
jgi:hypothetical protein